MGDSSDKFNEDSARELTEYVLKNDIKIYKKFLPVIKQLDSQSFYNMFKGNINYEYKIKNRLEFNLLLNKFDNFKILLEEWYTDKMKYPYIQELWLKYISLAGLSEKKNEIILEYLENRDIKVKFWDKDSRKELLNIISGTKNSVIENCRKQYEKLPGVIKESLAILNSLSKECIKEGQNALGIFAFGFGVSIVQELIFVSKDHFDVLSQVCSDLWQGRKLPNFSLKNGLEILKNNASKYKQIATNVFNSKLTLISYGAATALKLLNSIKSCTEIKDRSEQIKDFKETYEIIKNDYDTQIKRINDILEQKEYRDTLISFESLKICLEIIRGCSGRIKNLIVEIKKTIVENKKNKSKQIFELVISTIQTTVGIAGGKLSTGGNKIFYYGLGAINGVNCILNTVSLASIVNDISDLEELLKKSKELETEINQKIKELIELFNGFNGISPTFYEKINQKKIMECVLRM